MGRFGEACPSLEAEPDWLHREAQCQGLGFHAAQVIDRGESSQGGGFCVSTTLLCTQVEDLYKKVLHILGLTLL